MEHKIRQTSIRVDEEIIRKARYFLDKEDSNINDFVKKSLEKYLAEHEDDSLMTQREAV